VIDKRIEQEAIAWRDALETDPSPGKRAEFEAWRAADPRHGEAYDQQERLVAIVRASGHRGTLPVRRDVAHPRRWMLPVAGGTLAAAAAAGALYLTTTSRQPVGGTEAATITDLPARLVTMRLTDRSLGFVSAGTRLMSTADDRYRLEAGGGRFMVLALATTLPVTLLVGDYEVTSRDAVFDMSMHDGAVEVVALAGAVVVSHGRSGDVLMVQAGQAWSPARGRTEAALRDQAGTLRIDADGLRLDELVRLANTDGSPRIVLADGLGSRRLTGVVEISDTRALARKLGRVYGLAVQEREGSIHMEPSRRR